MPTLTANIETTVVVALESSITVTPGTSGYVDIRCCDAYDRANVAARRITSATDLTIPAGSRLFLLSSNSGATYDTVDADILNADGGVLSLSEVVEEALAAASDTTTVLTGAGNYSHYRCTTAAGNITVYDNTAASGKVLVPTTALAVGVFPIFGSGHSGRLKVDTGVTVVLSGAAVVYVGVEAD